MRQLIGAGESAFLGSGDDWNVLVQHTEQELETSGTGENSPVRKDGHNFIHRTGRRRLRVNTRTQLVVAELDIIAGGSLIVMLPSLTIACKFGNGTSVLSRSPSPTQRVARRFYRLYKVRR